MNPHFLRNIIISILFIFLVFFTPQCKKDDQEKVPYVYVDFYVNINNTQYLGLNNIGGFVYVTGGVRGIILYRRSLEEFKALERNCPYQPSNSCAMIEVDNSGMIAIDSCCGSQFLLMDGSVVTGPATIQLTQYQTSLSGNILHVFN